MPTQRRSFLTATVAALLVGAATLGASAPTFAQPAKAGPISVSHVWARAVPAPVRNSAAYLVIENQGAADRLLSASAAVAKETQLHTMVMDGGVMKMREVKGVDVPANGRAELKPGGDHVMLLGLSDGLKEGSRFPLRLKFEKAGELTVEVMVEKADAAKAPAGHGKH
ncbi:MAG: copper chaperone PCu(A)C [Burkholderiales bacterium]|nr:copper chaperone PCu(A)C [Burkholderiales bacterium]